MAIVNSSSFANSYRIGQVFTPLEWAKWAVNGDAFDDWVSGGVVLDPTGGDGVFLESLVQVANDRDVPVTDEMLARLNMIEIDEEHCTTARHRLGVLGVPDRNIVNADLFASEIPIRATSLVGNPPWINFTDLPETYKTYLKPLFVEFGLVQDMRRVLWGGSRVDLAALVLAKCVRDYCESNASVAMYLPLSLFMNDGAHDAFRNHYVTQNRIGLQELHDLSNRSVFEGVSTRYCLARMKTGTSTRFPIPFITHERDGATKKDVARPIESSDKSLVVGTELTLPRIRVEKSSIPRQGINTCGANRHFFFDSIETIDSGLVNARNDRGLFVLEKSLVFPLITSNDFKSSSASSTPSRFVFLPYDTSSGRTLSRQSIEGDTPFAWKYLCSIQEELRVRKGKMIQSFIDREQWWALLGVGTYTFAPFKIVWESYGKKTFSPRVFEGDWIPNQSLQAYMPCRTEFDAESLLLELQESNIEDCLKAGRMAGTASWAQPGKIKQFLEVVESKDQQTLF